MTSLNIDLPVRAMSGKQALRETHSSWVRVGGSAKSIYTLSSGFLFLGAGPREGKGIFVFFCLFWVLVRVREFKASDRLPERDERKPEEATIQESLAQVVNDRRHEIAQLGRKHPAPILAHWRRFPACWPPTTPPLEPRKRRNRGDRRRDSRGPRNTRGRDRRRTRLFETGKPSRMGIERKENVRGRG